MPQAVRQASRASEGFAASFAGASGLCRLDSAVGKTSQDGSRRRTQENTRGTEMNEADAASGWRPSRARWPLPLILFLGVLLFCYGLATSRWLTDAERLVLTAAALALL